MVAASCDQKVKEGTCVTCRYVHLRERRKERVFRRKERVFRMKCEREREELRKDEKRRKRKEVEEEKSKKTEKGKGPHTKKTRKPRFSWCWFAVGC